MISEIFTLKHSRLRTYFSNGGPPLALQQLAIFPFPLISITILLHKERLH